MRTLLKQLFCSPVFISSAVLVSRVVGSALEWWWRPWSLNLQGPYGWEVGRVAESIASGKGFGNPLSLFDTGPTAWLCPVYPYMVGIIFKLWGICSVKSHLVLLALNFVFAALTIFPIYSIAKRTFGAEVAVLASWIWFVVPSTWILPRYVWDSALDALSLALIFWATLAVRSQRRIMTWAAYGALWAIGALINASVLSLAPFLFGWLFWELRRQAVPWIRPMATAVLLFVLGVAPWTLRNYLVFGKFIPIRSNMGLMLWFGNHPGVHGIDTTLSPFANPVEGDLYRRMGEIPYMTAKKHEAVAFMVSHPGRTLGLTLHGVWTYWFEVSDRHNIPWYEGSTFVKAYFVLNVLLILGTFAGMALALRSRIPEAALYLSVLLFFPLVYYLTRPGLRFRFTIEPVLVVLAAYGAAYTLDWARERRSRHSVIPLSADSSSAHDL